MTIEVVNHCNLNCIYCYLNKDKITWETKTIKRIIDDARLLGTIDLILSGGEPLLHPDIAEIIRYARYKKMNVTLFSNLTVLNDEIIQLIRKYMITKG